MPQHLPPAAREAYLRRLRLQTSTLTAIRLLWALMGADFDAAWASIGPQILVLLSAAQLQAASDAAAYISLATVQQELDPTVASATNPRAWLGLASDGRSMATLLGEAIITTKLGVASGADVAAALRSGGSFLDLVTLTQIADTARAAELTTITATPTLHGYVRMLNPPSCSRCVILAGKHFSWKNDFRRHPRCDCLCVPVGAASSGASPAAVSPEGYFRSLTSAQQDATFGKAGAQAIREGASPITVVNANRGTYTASGNRGPTPGNRPTVGHIYDLAKGDRDRAVNLLRSAGYLAA